MPGKKTASSPSIFTATAAAASTSTPAPTKAPRPPPLILLQRIPANPGYGRDPTSSPRAPSVGAKMSSASTTASQSEALGGDRSHAPLSDVEILSSVPPSLLRLLALTAPFVHLLASLVRLASWTAGPHSASASVLLLIGWWALCTYTYPLLRYAPQAVPVSAIVWYYLKRHLSVLRSRPRPRAGSSSSNAASANGGAGADPKQVIGGATLTLPLTDGTAQEYTVHNGSTLSRTLSEIEEIADFFSQLYSLLIRPLLALLDWSDPERTLATLSFLALTYPLYLACFLPWDQLGLPRVALVLYDPSRWDRGLVPTLYSLAARAVGSSYALAGQAQAHARRALLAHGPEFAGELLQRADRLVELLQAQWSHVAPHLSHARQHALAIVGSVYRLFTYLRILPSSSASSSATLSSSGAGSAGSRPFFLLSLVPPYPFFSLTVSSLLLWSGTLALTWSSPLASLLRHALWRSAAVRFLLRRALQLLTLGRYRYVDAKGRDRMRHYSLFGAGAAKGGAEDGARVEEEDEENAANVDIFDRLLAGLDGAVPAPQIDLPSTKAVTDSEELGASSSVAKGSSSSSKKRRAVERHEDVVYQFSIFENQRWWVGLDWTAALLPQERPSWADEHNNPVSPPHSFSLPPAKLQLTPTPSKASPRAHMRRLVKWAWIDPEWTVAGAGFITAAAAGEGSGAGTGGLLEANGSITGSGTVAANLASNISEGLRNRFGAGSAPGSAAAGSVFSGDVASPTSVVDELDVDPDGWQYGDNAWDKMSKKNGLGRYTRRRKWVRRAVLIEIVEKDYCPPPDSA